MSETAKGLGNAVKSVGEGVGYAVVGSTKEVAKGINEGTKQAVNAVQNTAEDINQVVKDTADSVKAYSETTTQSAANVADSVKNIADDANESFENQSTEQPTSQTDYENASTFRSESYQ